MLEIRWGSGREWQKEWRGKRAEELSISGHLPHKVLITFIKRKFVVEKLCRYSLNQEVNINFKNIRTKLYHMSIFGFNLITHLQKSYFYVF